MHVDFAALSASEWRDHRCFTCLEENFPQVSFHSRVHEIELSQARTGRLSFRLKLPLSLAPGCCF